MERKNDNLGDNAAKMEGERMKNMEKDKNWYKREYLAAKNELLTLKACLKKSLTSDYLDYLAIEDEGMNAHTYETLSVVLRGIFKKLHRCGIALDS